MLTDSGDLTPTVMQPSQQNQCIAGGLTLQFQRDESGAIASFTVGIPRAEVVEFTRVTDCIPPRTWAALLMSCP